MIKKASIALLSVFVFTLAAPFALAQEDSEVAGAPPKSEGFTMEPANPNAISPRKLLFEIRPGETQKDSVIIKNLSDEPAKFYLYGADPTMSAQGTPAYKTRQNGGKAEGMWVQFDKPEVTLGAKQQQKVDFSITIPEDAELGEHRVGITMEKTKEDTNNPNITIATRFILHGSVNVTDMPKPIPKTGDVSVTDNPWQVYYFYGSLTLFIVSFLALIWVTIQEKKEKATTRSSSRKPAKKRAATTTKRKSARKKK